MIYLKNINIMNHELSYLIYYKKTQIFVMVIPIKVNDGKNIEKIYLKFHISDIQEKSFEEETGKLIVKTSNYELRLYPDKNTFIGTFYNKQEYKLYPTKNTFIGTFRNEKGHKLWDNYVRFISDIY